MAKLKSNLALKKSKKGKVNGFKAGKAKKLQIKPKKSHIKPKKEQKFNSKNVDDFMKQNMSDEELSDEEFGDDVDAPSEKSDDLNEENGENSESDIDMDDEINKDDSENEEEVDMDSADEAEQHKKSLAKLQETDPEFYGFLQENDKKLLNFNLSDEEGDDDSEARDVKREKLHKPSKDLEVASDESDYEGDEDTVKDNRVITLKLIKQWQNDIQTDKSKNTILNVTQAFHACLKRVSADDDQDEEPALFKVEGSSVFNGVIQLCVLELGPAMRRFLGISQSRMPPHKCKKFPKIKKILKGYFTDLLKLLLGVTSSNIQNVLLKHLHYLSPMLISYPNITKPLLKRLIHLWGTADDSVRVISFFCILRITNNNQQGLLDTTLKSMYVTYVKNSKFMSMGTLAPINFMRRSLVEMFALDANMAYQHVFLYIRQLAIHLRNAITVNKTENIQSVYNWQFINSLRLWGSLLSVNYHKPQFQQLVYPLVQVSLGTIKLVPTAQYYPLRFHVIQVLIDISKTTGVYVPILPFILEVLTGYDFNKKHQKVSMKPIHYTCILRLSKSQMQENGFKDTTIETIYSQMLEYLTNQSHSIAFTDLSLLCTIQIKTFLKKCKQANYIRKFKQLLEKIEQNNTFIENERKKENFLLTDFKKIEGWESRIRTSGTPLQTYYDSWSKVSKIKKNKQLTNADELGDYKLPTLNKKSKKNDDGKESKDSPVVLFPSDSEDEGEFEKSGKNKKRGKRGKSQKKRVEDSGPVQDDGEKDIVQDIDLNDW
ncbi:unnamed protein product [Brassicogethes aeneus]|uniref:Nucleolar complex protein 2 homolog n=1 Tax=Brassicogethes aeneus TaxID=1431903 RepID=A0A9P0BED9_BRAAE|nr:unnamed protein product [Brassicogethes aeneus]